MPLDVTLGDINWRWQLDGDRAVEDWLSRRPWDGSGGVLVVQASGDCLGTQEALHTAVYAADRRRSEVRVVSLSGHDGQGLVEVLAAWLNTSHRPLREVALVLADDLEVRPVVFFLVAEGAATVAAWVDTALALWDLTSKLEVRRPTFILAHRRGESPLRGGYELDRGWPVGLARALFQRSEDGLWARYLHLRFAWESGGVIDDARDCASIAGEIPSGQDDALERALNRFATEKFERMPTEERDAWTRFIADPIAANRVPTVYGRPEDREGRSTPFPWIARALLLRNQVRGGPIRALRAEMTCRPLSEQILNRCFAVEASLRGRLPAVLPVPPADLQETYDRFAARGAQGPSLEAELYPPSHPCPPLDAWDFASVGFVARYVPATDDNYGVRPRRVRHLRNAVAHCHYVGWRGLCEARALGALLAY